VITDWYGVSVGTIAGTVADMVSRVMTGVVVDMAAGLGLGAGSCEYEEDDRLMTVYIAFWFLG
jgi:hypothetical protein